MENLKKLIKQRNECYGDFLITASVAQELKRAIQFRGELPSTVKESLDMICTKIARITAGSFYLKDSWLDIQGYAQLIIDEIERRGDIHAD